MTLQEFSLAGYNAYCQKIADFFGYHYWLRKAALVKAMLGKSAILGIMPASFFFSPHDFVAVLLCPASPC